MSEILEKRTSADYWICPHCGRENGSKMICPGCGFDNSTNYMAYPTLMELPRQASDAQRTEEELEAKVQRLMAEVERLMAEVQGFKAAQPTQKRQSQSLKAAQPAQKKPNRSLMGNVGRNGYSSNIPSLDGVTKKAKITEVYFLNTLKNAPENAADLSAAKDRSVLCWTEGTVQYIAGDGGVVGGSSCKDLFTSYGNVTAIHFDGNFDTSRVTDMSGMFGYCYNLKSLNLSDWDTSRVEEMSEMFYGCTALKELNLSDWNTSCVVDMGEMFSDCYNLKLLNLSDWNTSCVMDMGWMFRNCYVLESLNLSGWDTSHVKEMRWMFGRCKSLTDFNPAWLDTTNADTTNMYTGTKWE